jgi:NAD(P)-dependent dehydrogenase (short-subunit alcohol dehydrogenase family)
MTAYTAIVTGAGQGFGLALAAALAERGSIVIGCGRDPARLHAALDPLPGATALPGDVTDPGFRAALVAAAGDRLDLLVHNAGELGPSPLPTLQNYPLDALRAVLETTVIAPLALTQLALPTLLANRGTVVTLSSDAAVEAYPGWGGYGASKAALEQLTAVFAAEHPEFKVYSVDPGDMRTRMHQDAFPGEDISDRPPPQESVPGLLALVDGQLESGRYRAAELAKVAA